MIRSACGRVLGERGAAMRCRSSLGLRCSNAQFSTTSDESSLEKPWETPMPERTFTFMRDILASPSPVGLEGAMVAVIEKERDNSFASSHQDWSTHRFKGNSSVVFDTAPGRDDLPSVMIVGHTDKIRMQVRHIASDGKIYIDSDSFLPLTLIGNKVDIYSRVDGEFRCAKGGTVESLGAIHFSSAAVRTGEKGVPPKDLYVELGIHGEDCKDQVERTGIKVGDSILMNRPIERCFAPSAFSGAYLDNGLGCFVTAEVARLVAETPVEGVRTLFAFASHEEIGRFGSSVVTGTLKPDVLIAVDVNHDYSAAPNVGDRRFPPLKMGAGFTLSHGSIVSSALNSIFEQVASEKRIPIQHDVVGRDTGTDAMSAVLSGTDSAATSIGFPIRNMHTVSELGHTGDVLASVHAIHGVLEKIGSGGLGADHFKSSHPNLDAATPLEHDGVTTKVSKDDGAKDE